MKNILITGASGNVGSSILKYVSETKDQIWEASYKLPLRPNERYFNFQDLRSTQPSLKNLDLLFLLRPPNLSDTEKYFKPLIQLCQASGVKHIVFLSVQGVENSKIIPHYKIEELIKKSGIKFTFIRPSYFMQNLTTTLKKDIQKGEIFLPAGHARFLWVDVDDVGKAIAKVISNEEAHQNKVYTITGNEYFSFNEVCEKISNAIQRPVRFISPNLTYFLFRKLKEGTSFTYAMVIIMLHYLARFQNVPPITSDFYQLTGTIPTLLDDFIFRHRSEWRE